MYPLEIISSSLFLLSHIAKVIPAGAEWSYTTMFSHDVKRKKRGNACIQCIQYLVSAVIRTAHAPWQKPIAKRANDKQEEVERERAETLNETTNLSVIAVGRDRVISCELHRLSVCNKTFAV